MEVEVEVVVAVYWLACGASYRVTADAFGMPLSTVCRTVYGVVEEMMAILHRVIHFPKAEEMEGLGKQYFGELHDKMSTTKKHRAMGSEEWVARLKAFACSGTWPSGAGNRPSPKQGKWHNLYQKMSTKKHRAMGSEEWVRRLKAFASSGTLPSRAGNRPSPKQAKWHNLYQKIE
ncbi:unnamed protein product [Gadus morhua 'NCC']